MGSKLGQFMGLSRCPGGSSRNFPEGVRRSIRCRVEMIADFGRVIVRA